MDRVSTGTKLFDELLNGGYEKGVITTIYGPAGGGKTTLCLLCLINIAKSDKKIIYIDTENGFSVERLSQLADNYKDILAKILFLRPQNFDEQKKDIEKLSKIINKNIGLIILDTIAMLYRLELKNEGVYEINRELGKQISHLSQIASKVQLPILITNQVYADFEDKTKTHIVGGDLLKYGSKCIIELQVTANGNRRAILRKHRSIPEEKEVIFKIVQKGIESAKEGKGFRLF